MKVRRAVILDGYVDEPTCLGVPPYISPYPRYVAGALLSHDKNIDVVYYTIDEARESRKDFLSVCSRSDLVIMIGGTVVPGKYLSGKPATIKDFIFFSSLIEEPLKVIGGPVARFGAVSEGGKASLEISKYKGFFDFIVSGDLEAFIKDLLDEGPEKAETSLYLKRTDLGDIPITGSTIVKQHPFYPYVICEIETYRGCPRYIVGGCSFCTTPFYGKPDFRDQKEICREVKALYENNIKFFRLGCQADLLTFKGFNIGEAEFPKPNVEALKKLYVGVRRVAPKLEVLHMDNANPGTIANWPLESREILKIIVEMGTPGDVAALGVESSDERVIRENNLKTSPEESFFAIKLINEVGSRRGWNGLPRLLPGINFVHGLKGETKETFIKNFEFLKRILENGLLVRRINIRQVMVFKGTPMYRFGLKNVFKHKKVFWKWRKRIREEIDLPMLRKVLPKGTILRRVFTEKKGDGYTFGRQLGTYPLIVKIKGNLKLREFVDVRVQTHSYRSIKGVPLTTTNLKNK